jgi:hypothetical protein
VKAKIQAPAQKFINLNDQHSQIPDDKTQGYKVYGATEFAVPRAATIKQHKQYTIYKNIHTHTHTHTYIYILIFFFVLWHESAELSMPGLLLDCSGSNGFCISFAIC